MAMSALAEANAENSNYEVWLCVVEEVVRPVVTELSLQHGKKLTLRINDDLSGRRDDGFTHVVFEVAHRQPLELKEGASRFKKWVSPVLGLVSDRTVVLQFDAVQAEAAYGVVDGSLSVYDPLGPDGLNDPVLILDTLRKSEGFPAQTVLQYLMTQKIRDGHFAFFQPKVAG